MNIKHAILEQHISKFMINNVQYDKLSNEDMFMYQHTIINRWVVDNPITKTC